MSYQRTKLIQHKTNVLLNNDSLRIMIGNESLHNNFDNSKLLGS